MNIDATFRPIEKWPGELTRSRRRSPFRASWGMTLDLLKTEIRHLRGRQVVIEMDLRALLSYHGPNGGTP